MFSHFYKASPDQWNHYKTLFSEERFLKEIDHYHKVQHIKYHDAPSWIINKFTASYWDEENERLKSAA